MDLYKERKQFPSRYNFDDDLEYFNVPCEDILSFKPEYLLPPLKPRHKFINDDDINLQSLINQMEELKQQIETLCKTDETPGSIEYIVKDIVSKMDISDFQKEEILAIYGGSATDVIKEEKL